MKKRVSLLCAGLMALTCMTGCSNGTSDQSSQNTQAAASPSSVDLTEAVAGEITVSYYDATYYGDFLESAAKAFEEKYPDTKINLETSSAMPEVKSSTDGEGGKSVSIEAEDDTQAQSDYISKVNTALMSGSGADVLAMDVIPHYKYAENGQLEDLQSYMDSDSDFDTADYRMNVIEALKYKGGQYVFPLDYSFNYYEYDASLFDESGVSTLQSADSFTMEELVSLAQENENAATHPILGMKGYANPVSGTSVFSELFLSNYGSYIDLENKTADFTSGKFASMLDTIREWEAQGYILNSSSADLSIEDFTESTDTQYFYKLKYDIELLTRYLRQEGMEVAVPLAGVSPSTTDNDTVLGLGKGQDGAQVFTYNQAYGMNANSQNKRLAWEFIKFMASQEMQESLQMQVTGLLGYPIHNEARNNKAADGIVGELFMQTGEPTADKTLTEAQQAALDTYVDATEKFSDMLNVCPIEDVTINSIIHAEVKAFFEGQSTAEDVASAIQSKVDMYLNE